jgi:hypothetical protein
MIFKNGILIQNAIQLFKVCFKYKKSQKIFICFTKKFEEMIFVAISSIMEKSMVV